ncbi:MAG: HAMP domain-containing protein [bacterium]|nr:HAMP domain-containing protein [bacterium]
MNRMFNNLSVARKLLALPLIVVVSMAGLVALAYVGFARQSAATDDLYNNRFIGYQNCSRVVNDVNVVHRNIYKVLGLAAANADASIIEKLATEQLAALDATQKFATELLAQESLLDEERALLGSAVEKLAPYRDQAAMTLDMAQTDFSVALTFMVGADTSFQTLHEDLSALQALEDKLGRENHAGLKTGFRVMLVTFILVAAVIGVFTTLASLLITRMISRRLRETMGVIGRVADGDLTHEIADTSGDELGRLAQSVDTMRARMGAAVGESKGIAHHLSDAATAQAAALEQTAASLDELESMTRRNADSTGEANRLLAEANGIITQANRSMAQLAVSTKEIAEASLRTQNVVKSIDEIAFQTNLLALNAAVEAARAGQAGAGFAVVAEEVRNLARRATQSAQSTSGLIEDTMQKVHDGERLAEATRTDFDAVAVAADRVVALMSGIAGATREQSEGIGQISRAVNEMNAVVQRNVTASAELSAAMSVFRTGAAEDEYAEGEFAHR